MNKGIYLSVILHLSLTTFFWLGAPLFQKNIIDDDIAIIVDLVEVEDLLRIKEEDNALSENDQIEVNEEISSINSILQPQVKDTFESLVDEKVGPITYNNPLASHPKKKPKPPPLDKFAELVSLVKNLEKEVDKRPKNILKSNNESSKKINPIENIIQDKATITERNAIRLHIERCWRIDPGKEGLRNLSVDLRVTISPTGKVIQAIIEDTSRYFSDSNFRTFANSARNAVLSCTNVPISPERYEIFKEIVFTFTPKGRIN